MAGVWFLALTLSLLTSAVAETRESLGGTRQKAILSGQNCIPRPSCDLTEIEFRVEKYRYPPSAQSDVDLYNTEMYISYTTKDIDALEHYVFVQFIRGCVWTSGTDSRGVEENTFTVLRRHMPGGHITFRHSDWEIDSVDVDPVYFTDGNASSRHYQYQWLPRSDEWRPGREGEWYGLKKPLFPKLFVTDAPQAAYVSASGDAVNTSLEFQTCLFYEKDVPKTLSPGSVGFARPIQCFLWDHKFVYHRAEKLMVPEKEISRVCARPFNSTEEEIDRKLRARK